MTARFIATAAPGTAVEGALILFCGRDCRPGGQRASTMVTLAMPPPSHMV